MFNNCGDYPNGRKNEQLLQTGILNEVQYNQNLINGTFHQGSFEHKPNIGVQSTAH